MAEMIKNEIRNVPIDTLIPAPYNPRKISKQALKGLAASIKRFGLVQPIVVNKRSNLVVGGHQRLEALKVAGETSADVLFVDLSDSEEKALNIALNAPSISGHYTDDLQEILDSLREEIPHDFMDFRFDELLIHTSGSASGKEDDVPDLPKSAVTKRGDLWKLGEHLLLCADSASEGELSKLSKIADGMWTDPPYGVRYVGKTKKALTIQNDGSGTLETLLAGAFNVANQKLCEGASIYVAHPDGALSVEFDKAFLEADWRFHETIIWAKSSVVMGHSDYQFKHEPIIYGWKGKSRKWYGGRNQSSILEFDRPARSSVHPTMKPVSLIVKCLSNSSIKGSLWFDPFLGSGSTLIACEQTHRRCMGTELDPKYCDVIIERFENFTGQSAKKL